jgi:hypothetical protein
MINPKRMAKDFQNTMEWMESFLASTDPASASSKVRSPSIAPSPLTQTASTAELQYRISDPVGSDCESGSDDYCDPSATQVRGQEIPSWAFSANVLAQLRQQQGVDPDLIFTNFDKTCDLGEMFGKKKRTYRARGDSACWTKDAITPAEEMRYKKAIGLA